MVRLKLLVVVLAAAMLCMGSVANAAVLTSDAHTRLLLHFNEGSGTIAYDSSTYGNNGTIEGSGVAFSNDGLYGGGLYSPAGGYENRVNFGGNQSLYPRDAITFETWVKVIDVGPDDISPPNDQTFFQNGLCLLRWNNNLLGNKKQVLNGGVLLMTQRPDGSWWAPTYWITAYTNWNDNEWHHVAMTFDGTTMALKLYVDGAEVSGYTITTPGFLPANDWGHVTRVGGGYVGYPPALAILDEVRLSDVARTAAEIAYAVDSPPVANAGINIFATTADTIVLDGSGSSDPDGTVVGYAWDLDADGVADATGVHPNVTSEIGGKLKLDTFNTVSLTVTDNKGATSPPATVLVIVVDYLTLTNRILNLEGQISAIEDNLESKGYNVVDPETADTINAAIDSLYSDLNNAKLLLSEIYAAVGSGTNALNVVAKIGQLNTDLAAAKAQIVTLTAQVASAIEGLGKIRTLIATPFGQRSNPGYVSNSGDTVVAPVVNQIIDDLLTPFGQINNQRNK